jgi:signal transduction histidine kinase
VATLSRSRRSPAGLGPPATASVSRVEEARSSAHGGSAALAVGIAGTVATAVTVWSSGRSRVLVEPTELAVWRGLLVASYIAVGTYTWWRRPESRVGPLVAGAGFAYATTSMVASGVALVYTLGMVAWAATTVYVGYVYLCLPAGRLESRLERGFVLAFALSTAVVWGLILVFAPALPTGGAFIDCGKACPPNALLVVSGHPALGAALDTTFHIVLAISLIGIAMLIFSKARSSGFVRRRELMPLVVVLVASLAEFVIALFLLSAYPGTRATFRVTNGLLRLAIPLAVFIGQVRGERLAAMNLAQIAVGASGKPLTRETVQKLIGDALGDPSLTLALWAPEQASYVDVDGARLELPRDTGARSVIRLFRDSVPVAALIHDPVLDPNPEVVEALTATSLMLLENTRLVHELRQSRTRIVRAGERERRRLEHDLHDGAQAQLVAIQIRLELVRELTDPAQIDEQIVATQRDLETALEELRDLAHGIYPAALRDLGPAGALHSLALNSSVPVEVIDDWMGRSSDDTEAAIYFCAREAIQNTAKHAGPGAKTVVTLKHDERGIELTVSDDGIGLTRDADTDGMGITGMQDRIESVGGRIEIVSAPGRGTSVCATIPDGAA